MFSNTCNDGVAGVKTRFLSFYNFFFDFFYVKGKWTFNPNHPNTEKAQTEAHESVVRVFVRWGASAPCAIASASRTGTGCPAFGSQRPKPCPPGTGSSGSLHHFRTPPTKTAMGD